jgi:hypothetical protein
LESHNFGPHPKKKNKKKKEKESIIVLLEADVENTNKLMWHFLKTNLRAYFNNKTMLDTVLFDK